MRLKLRTCLPIDLVPVSAAPPVTLYLFDFHRQLWQYVSLKEDARPIKGIPTQLLFFWEYLIEHRLVM